MKTIKTTKTTLSRATAEQGLNRAMQFLRTVGTDGVIRTAMQKTGFALEDMKQGWALVLKACSAPTTATQFTPEVGPVADATQRIEAWQSTMFLRTHAALRRLHPEQDAFVFDNLESGSGVAAVVSVSMFLEHLDALENGADRKATRKSDHAALATLEQRGVTKDERKQVKQLVHVVETTPAPAVVEDPTPQADERMEALTELYGWVQDWSDCARTVITRRDQLLRLGIGKRRARVSAPVEPTTPAAPPVAPSAPPPAQLPAAPAAAQSNGASNGAIVLA